MGRWQRPLLCVLLSACWMHTAAVSSALAAYTARHAHLQMGPVAGSALEAARAKVKEPLRKESMQSNALNLLAKYRQTKAGAVSTAPEEEEEDQAAGLEKQQEDLQLTEALIKLDFQPEQIEKLKAEFYSSKQSLPNLAQGKRIDYVIRKLYPRESTVINQRMHDGTDPLANSELAQLMGEEVKGWSAIDLVQMKSSHAGRVQPEHKQEEQEEQGKASMKVKPSPPAPFWYKNVLQELAAEEAGGGPMAIEGRDAKPDLEAEMAALGGNLQNSAFAKGIEADKEQDKAELKTLLRKLERKDRAERILHTGLYAFAAVLGCATALYLSTRGYDLGANGDSADQKNDIAKRISLLRNKQKSAEDQAHAQSQALADEIGRVV